MQIEAFRELTGTFIDTFIEDCIRISNLECGFRPSF